MKKFIKATIKNDAKIDDMPTLWYISKIATQYCVKGTTFSGKFTKNGIPLVWWLTTNEKGIAGYELKSLDQIAESDTLIWGMDGNWSDIYEAATGMNKSVNTALITKSDGTQVCPYCKQHPQTSPLLPYCPYCGQKIYNPN